MLVLPFLKLTSDIPSSSLHSSQPVLSRPLASSKSCLTSPGLSHLINHIHDRDPFPVPSHEVTGMPWIGGGKAAALRQEAKYLQGVCPVNHSHCCTNSQKSSVTREEFHSCSLRWPCNLGLVSTNTCFPQGVPRDSEVQTHCGEDLRC